MVRPGQPWRVTHGNWQCLRTIHAKKSDEGDHFAAAIGRREQLEGFVPTIPDLANDKHGKKRGRGIKQKVER